MNFFQPSMKLISKHRDGSKVQRKYDAAQLVLEVLNRGTPLQRLVGFGSLTEERNQHWNRVFQALDPVRLLQQIQSLQNALWRHAVEESETSGQSVPQHVCFDLAACLPPGSDDHELDVSSTVETTAKVQKRKYRRTQKSRAPRTYRTHPDPFEAVAAELHQWFLDAPDRTAKSLLQKLQEHYPGRYPDNQLRTLQRRVRTWRSQMILEFDDGLTREDAQLNTSLPPSLRAIPLTDTCPSDADSET